jgi:hypothetical protein
MKSSLFLPILCTCLCLLSGCGRPTPDSAKPETQAVDAPEPAPAAAEADDPEAVFQQASQLLKQTDQPVAVAFGVAMMREAADQGHPKAQSLVGFHLAQGENKDLPAAVGYLCQAALAGDKYAAQNLRRLHDKFLEDHPEEKPKVVQALRDAAGQGSVPAASELGAMYYFGSSNLGQDYGQALPWLRQAAEGGDLDAANTLGVIYAHGQGVTEDWEKALEFYGQAAAGGHVKAQASLGLAYAVGHGAPRDLERAFQWLRLSARAGEATGKNALADFIRGLSKDQIRRGHRQVAEFLRARGEEVTAEQLDEEIFNPKMPTLEDLQKEMPKPSPVPTPDDRA